MDTRLQTKTVVAEGLSLKLVRLTKRTHQKKNLNVAQIKYFTFAENYGQSKEKAIINFLEAESLK